MERSYAKSANAKAARVLLEKLQLTFVQALEEVSAEQGAPQKFTCIDWLRDEGRHGGGNRYVCVETPIFNRVAVNVSGVHYDDEGNKKLSSADALSTIIHPASPHAPSVHLHFSWTEMRDGHGGFRMMADLNPCIEDVRATQKFQDALRSATPDHYQEAASQGDRYFRIPALDRHRGATHFYLEGFSSGDFTRDLQLTSEVATAAIECYIETLRSSLANHREVTEDDKLRQLAYHTIYFFQVLSLDRGTTSGLLVHDQNDLGIMGSLPAYVDRDLLASWADKVPPPQHLLVRALVNALPPSAPSHVTDEVRLALAQIVRDHYRENPQALALQAAGNSTPPTVDNHSAKQ